MSRASGAITGSADHRQEFGPRARVGAKVTEQLARDHRHAVLAHAARRHALVGSFDHDAHTSRLQHVLNAVRDLRGQRFLHLQPAGERFDDACQLADADDFSVGKVADVHSADDRRHVMLAVRLEADVAQHDHLVVALDLAERAPQELERVFVVPAEPIFVGADDSARCSDEAFAIGVVADPLQQRADGRFCLFARGLAVFGLGRGSSWAGRHSVRLVCEVVGSLSLGSRVVQPNEPAGILTRRMAARHLLQSFDTWRAAGEPLVLATVYETAGSTYSKAGHRILLAANGDYRGLVSGGCLEGDLAERARGVIATAQAGAVTYDLRDSADDLFGLGVGC